MWQRMFLVVFTPQATIIFFIFFFIIKICMILNEGQGKNNWYVMHSHDWCSHRAKCDDDDFSSFWGIAGDHKHTDRQAGAMTDGMAVYEKLFKIFMTWKTKSAYVVFLTVFCFLTIFTVNGGSKSSPRNQYRNSEMLMPFALGSPKQLKTNMDLLLRIPRHTKATFTKFTRNMVLDLPLITNVQFSGQNRKCWTYCLLPNDGNTGPL